MPVYSNVGGCNPELKVTINGFLRWKVNDIGLMMLLVNLLVTF